MFEIKSIEWDCKYILLLQRWAWFQLSQGLQCSFGTSPMKGRCHKVGLNIWCLYLALRHLLNLNGPFQCTKLSFTYRKYVNNLLDESMPKSIYLILLVLFTCHLDYFLWVSHHHTNPIRTWTLGCNTTWFSNCYAQDCKILQSYRGSKVESYVMESYSMGTGALAKLVHHTNQWFLSTLSLPWESST